MEMTLPVGQVSASGLAAIGNSTVGADAELILYSDQIKKAGERVQDIMDKIKLGSKLRETISRRLNLLREMKSVMHSAADGNGNIKDEKAVTDALKEHCGGTKNDKYELMDKVLGHGGGFEATINPASGEMQITNEDRSLFEANKKVENQPIEAEIKRLEDELSKLDADSQLTMVRLNQETNNKNRAVTLLTNLLKAKNDALRGILANLRSA
jgi:predicted DNA-binding protein YlxM (UPF0122 family)